MTTALALEFIPRRMKDLGYPDYYISFRHLVLREGEKVELDAFNQLYILVEEVADVTIDSDFGYYDLSDAHLNEQSYEHQGNIKINNNSPGVVHIRFIQVIPKN